MATSSGGASGDWISSISRAGGDPPHPMEKLATRRAVEAAKLPDRLAAHVGYEVFGVGHKLVSFGL